MGVFVYLNIVDTNITYVNINIMDTKHIRLEIPTDLHKSLKTLAILRDQTLRDLIIKILETYILDEGYFR